MMLRRNAMLSLFVGLLVPAVARAATPNDDVKAAYAAWDAAFNKGDAKAVAAFYTDDAVLLPSTHEVIRGPAEIEKYFAGLFANGVTGHKLEFIEANSDATMMVAAARWSAKAKDASVGGVATHEFRKQADGNLKLRLHIFN